MSGVIFVNQLGRFIEINKAQTGVDTVLPKGASEDDVDASARSGDRIAKLILEHEGVADALGHLAIVDESDDEALEQAQAIFERDNTVVYTAELDDSILLIEGAIALARFKSSTPIEA